MRHTPTASAARPRQRGQINLPRLFTVIAIFVAILAVPLYFLKGRAKARDTAAAIEQAQVAPPAGASPAAQAPAAEPAREAAADPNRFGLSFGWMPDPSGDRIHVSCHGEPRGVGQPHRDSCNPYRGDTSCRTALPLLCTRDVQGDPPHALATSPPVPGFHLRSVSDAHQRCVDALGAGWRMASFHDSGGWEIHGQGLVGTQADRRNRVWVAIGDQPGNCWDRP
jgi:hypothetical protein